MANSYVPGTRTKLEITGEFLPLVENDDGKRTMRSVNVQKRYLDGEEAKYTSSFNLAELPQALRVLQLAQEYVEAREADIPLGD